MKIEFIANDGYPVERIMKRPIQNFLRILIHTKKLRIKFKK